MNQVMSLSEANREFDAEWVLFTDAEVDDQFEVVKGMVLWHGPDRDEMHRKLIDLQPKNAPTHFTGRVPDDVVIIL